MSSVEEVVSPFLRQARPTGSDSLRSTCPLCGHARTFLVSLSRGTFICFSCQERGGLPRLLRLLGMSREEVDRRLQGVQYEKKKKFSFCENKNILPEYVLGAFQGIPRPLVRAGFSEEILEDHEVGFDKKAMRITFPIRDHLGRLVAVSGRAFPTGYPRYLVYRDIFDAIVPGYVPSNREHLYGMDTVYPRKYHDPADVSPIVIVEGYKACLWMRQNGFDNTVALQGSSMTPYQEIILKRLRGPKYVFLDNEKGKGRAGPRGFSALSIAKRLLRAGDARVCVYPEQAEEGTSPDDLDRTQLQEALTKAKTTSQIQLGLYNGI